MDTVEIQHQPRRGPGRPPGAKNKPKPAAKLAAAKKQLTESRVLESLGINSLHPAPKIAKEIKRLAEETGFTLRRIFDDMCENGIIEIQTMYLEVINARRDVQKALQALDGKNAVKTPSQPESTVRNGTVEKPSQPVAREAEPELDSPEQFDDAPVQRGFSPPSGAAIKGSLIGGGVEFDDPFDEIPENEIPNV